MQIRALLASAFAVLLGACHHPPTEPEFGTLRVSLVTIGGDFDLDDYVLVVDHNALGVVRSNGAQDIGPLPAGEHIVRLDGMADNCEVAGSSTRSVTIEPDRTAEVEFTITCYATGIEVIAVTSGLDFPDIWFLQVDTSPLQAILVNGSVLRTRLSPGSHTLALTSLTANCTLQSTGGEVVTVVARQVTSVTLPVSCIALSGVVELTVVTTGVDPDPTGYVGFVGPHSKGLSANSVTGYQLSPGMFSAELLNVAENCRVQGPNPQAVLVRAGGMSRDTSRVRFEVVCTPVEKLAFVLGDEITVAYADGSNGVAIANGRAPDWSPDGNSIVFEAISCPASILSNYSDPPPITCKGTGLAVIGADGSSFRTLTTNAPDFGPDRNPAWSPDGHFIAYERDAQLFLISSHEGWASALTTPGPAWSPSWSPDGLRLVFTCQVVLGNADLCLINRDGTGFQRLTTHPLSDLDPAWSPDGTRIAFTTNRFTGRDDIALLELSSGNVVRLTSGFEPAWSPDGTRLVASIYGLGLFIINADGSDSRFIRRQGEYAPSWRR